MDTFDFKYIPRYHSRSYSFQYDLQNHAGRILAEWSQYKEFIDIRSDIAGRIYDIISSEEIQTSGSDCHVTADYIAGIGNNFNNVVESAPERMRNLIHNREGEQEYIEFNSVHTALESMQIPFICRIMSDEGWEHSLVVLGSLLDGTILGFEQRGEQGERGFAEVDKSVQAYRGVHIFCKEI